VPHEYVEGMIREGMKGECEGGESGDACRLLHRLGIIHNPIFSCWHCAPSCQDQDAVV